VFECKFIAGDKTIIVNQIAGGVLSVSCNTAFDRFSLKNFQVLFMSFLLKTDTQDLLC
jgi:hypothetical protein